jgi:hypothetical protein
LFTGTSGGGGSAETPSGQGEGKSGGKAGGLVILAFNYIDLSGADSYAVSSNGEDGGGGGGNDDCGGGGGGGGQVYIRAFYAKLGTNKLKCAGGAGGSGHGTNGRNGGPGGAGRVNLECCGYEGSTDQYMNYAQGFSFCAGGGAMLWNCL